MKKKISRLDIIPKYGTTLRTGLISALPELPSYQEGLNKGLRFFTERELADIKEKYQKGMTWEDIDKELSGKGIIFKKPTFRKYIQEGNISKAIGYIKSAKGRVAIFPADTIAHINFVQYFYKVMSGEHIDDVISAFEPSLQNQISYYEAIESDLGNIYATIYDRLCFDGDEIDVAIEKALECRPNDRDRALEMLNKIQDKFDKIIGKEISVLDSFLKKNRIAVFETIKVDEVKSNE